jgi:hypothetical protein
MPSQTQQQSIHSILDQERHAAMCRLVSREDDEWIAAAESSLKKDADQAAIHFQAANNFRIAREVLAQQKAPTLHMSSVQSPEAPSAIASLAYNRLRLRVTVQDRVIQAHDDATTFANAICEIGCDKVSALQLVLNCHPLVSKDYQRRPHQHYAMQRIRRGEWTIITHCNTVRKKDLLRLIGTRLGICVLAEDQ